MAVSAEEYNLKYGHAKRYNLTTLQVRNLLLQMANADSYTGIIDGKWGPQSMRAYEDFKRKGFRRLFNKKTNQEVWTTPSTRIKQAVYKKSNQLPAQLTKGLGYVLGGGADSDMGVVGRSVEAAASAVGLSDKWSSKLGNGVELFSYLTTVGNYAAAYDAVEAARRGDWKEAGMNALFALPVVGNLGKVLRTGTKFVKTGKALEKAAGSWIANKPLTYYGYWNLGNLPFVVGTGIRDNYNQAKEDTLQYNDYMQNYNKAKQLGIADKFTNEFGTEDEYKTDLVGKDNLWDSSLYTLF